MALLTGQSWRVLKSWFIGGGPEQGFRPSFADGHNNKLISVCGAGSLILGNEFTFRSNRSSAAASTLSTSGAMGLSEKTFLNPKKMTASKEVRDEKGPSLDDFDKEIEIYQVCLNPISTLSQSR